MNMVMILLMFKSEESLLYRLHCDRFIQDMFLWTYMLISCFDSQVLQYVTSQISHVHTNTDSTC